MGTGSSSLGASTWSNSATKYGHPGAHVLTYLHNANNLGASLEDKMAGTGVRYSEVVSKTAEDVSASRISVLGRLPSGAGHAGNSNGRPLVIPASSADIGPWFPHSAAGNGQSTIARPWGEGSPAMRRRQSRVLVCRFACMCQSTNLTYCGKDPEHWKWLTFPSPYAIGNGS